MARGVDWVQVWARNCGHSRVHCRRVVTCSDHAHQGSRRGRYGGLEGEGVLISSRQRYAGENLGYINKQINKYIYEVHLGEKKIEKSDMQVNYSLPARTVHRLKNVYATGAAHLRAWPVRWPFPRGARVSCW